MLKVCAEFWQGLSRAARAGLVCGLGLILVMVIGLSVWLFSTDYQALFSDLTAQDTAAMVAELERMKIPHKLAPGASGTVILVEKDILHQTRIKLMGKDIPLHGTVGFELFNNADFGMTEFAQKINYQRALQGELTRTILSLAEVADVRVHLALPEEGLFKRANSKAKAAITLNMKHHQSLRSEQVAGIQGLVAAAVPGISASDVTIVDQQGVALTRAAQADGDGAASSHRLDLQKETENYLRHKLDLVLTRTFGEAQAMASVDVSLNMDQVRTTTEEVLGTPVSQGQIPTGVMVRERETLHDAAPDDGKAKNGSSQREVDYQTGRRIEQVVSAPGAIRRLHVVAVVWHALDAGQITQLCDTLAAAAGAVPERGDTVVVQAMAHPLVRAEDVSDIPAQVRSSALPIELDRPVMLPTDSAKIMTGLLSVMAIVIILVSLIILQRKRRTNLSAAQRKAVLAQLRCWLRSDTASAGDSHVAQNDIQQSMQHPPQAASQPAQPSLHASSQSPLQTPLQQRPS